MSIADCLDSHILGRRLNTAHLNPIDAAIALSVHVTLPLRPTFRLATKHKDTSESPVLPIHTSMASVSSLDQDMRKLRADRYTPKAANDIRDWIEETLREQLPTGDLLETLKDGTILCRYVQQADGGIPQYDHG